MERTMTATGYFVNNAGTWLEEFQTNEGEYVFQQVTRNLTLVPVPEQYNMPGKYMTKEAHQAHAAQHASDSHRAYFERLSQSKDSKEVRQSMKRIEELTKQIENVLVTAVAPSAHTPNVVFWTDEKYLDAVKAYEKLRLAGRHQESEFQPIQVYYEKLFVRGGKGPLRPMYKGEAGFIEEKNGSGQVVKTWVVCLQSGFGVGNFAQVPETVASTGKVIL